MAETTPGAGRPGVIHDLGYRRFDGTREGAGTIGRTLFVTGLRHAYGLGRSGRSKVLPFLLLAMSTLPAIIVIGVLVLTPITSLPVSYASYTNDTQLLVSLFAAAQAPVLFSRDLRYRSIVLYLARPLSAPAFAMVRFLSLTAAIWLFVALPALLLYVGALLAGLDVSEQTGDVIKALVLQVLLAALLAGISGLISSVSLRRGFAVVGSVMALIVASGVVTAIQAISAEQDSEQVGMLAGLFSPWSLYSGLGEAWDAGVDVMAPASGAWALAYALVGLLVVASCVLGLVARFQRAGAR